MQRNARLMLIPSVLLAASLACFGTPPTAPQMATWEAADKTEVAGTATVSAELTQRVVDNQNAPEAAGTFTSARLEIDSQQATTEMKPLWGCQAPIGGYLIVMEDGTLEGVCDENLYDGKTVKHGTLSGKYDAAAGSVTFTLLTESTVTIIDGGQYHTTETFVGGGSMVSANTATGEASFTFHCVVTVPSDPVNSSPGDTVGCNPNKDASFSMEGLVPFKITFIP